MKLNLSVPWRYETDLKKILVGEMLLIRTNYKQAAAVYSEFFKYFPGAEVPPEKKRDALRILRKAGLKHRAEGILKALDYLKDREGFDINIDELIKIPYVNKYIASAVLFFTGQGEIIYPDSNIMRILERYFGIKGKDRTHPSTRQIKLLEFIITRFKSREEKRRFSLNLLDFGLTLCLPKNPRCTVCPLRNECCYPPIQTVHGKI